MAYVRPRESVLTALLHEVVKAGGPFDTLADLMADTKEAAARRRIPYNAELLTAALLAVARTREVLASERPRPSPRRPGADQDARPYSRAEAAAFLSEWGVRV